MIKREQDSVQRKDISFGQDTLGWALWRLSLVLRDIAAADGQTEKPKNIEKEEPPSQAPARDVLTGGTN
jgi:hypothetical protein